MKCDDTMKNKLFAMMDAALSRIDRELIVRHKAKGLGNDKAMRFRWDVLAACRIDTGFMYDAGLNDSHIDTVLKQYVASRGY